MSEMCQPSDRRSARRPRHPGPEPRFSREQVAARALAIMDVQGPGALTMRALAAELGMGTMALYRYFASKRELIDAAIEAAAPEIELPDHADEDWKPALARLARQLFEAGKRHPSLARERFERPLTTAGARRVTDAAIALLLRAGLDKPEAVAAFKALLTFTLGAAVASASESRPDIRRDASAAHAAVSSELPAMASVADQLTAALGGDQAFELGLAALLNEIERRGARQITTPPT